nr:MAG TPA: hypothetical protein [Caudoviricetes sp.]
MYLNILSIVQNSYSTNMMCIKIRKELLSQ